MNFVARALVVLLASLSGGRNTRTSSVESLAAVQIAADSLIYRDAEARLCRGVGPGRRPCRFKNMKGQKRERERRRRAGGKVVIKLGRKAHMGRPLSVARGSSDRHLSPHPIVPLLSLLTSFILVGFILVHHHQPLGNLHQPAVADTPFVHPVACFDRAFHSLHHRHHQHHQQSRYSFSIRPRPPCARFLPPSSLLASASFSLFVVVLLDLC